MNPAVQLAPENKHGLLLSNPVMAASGTFGYGTEDYLFDIQKLGAIVCKGTTLEPREGNPQPRLAETPAGLLNSIGLQNIGVEALIKEKAPLWAGWRVPVVVNIAGSSVEEYAGLAKRLDGVPGVSALEVNISCPNVKEGCVEFGADPRSAARVTAAVRKATSLPVLVKLTPNTSDIVAVAAAVAEAGADALCLINTLKGMAMDIVKRRPLLGNITGGLSGPAIKPVALYMVYEVAGAVSVPVVGCGGISTATDAIEFILAGATAVQVGTAGFTNPTVYMDILKGIEEWMAGEGIKDIKELVGVGRIANLEEREMDYNVSLVYQKLLKEARAKSLTSYTEVGQLVGLDMATDVGRIRIAQILDEINQYEAEFSRPMLSALVILKDKKVPGSGFFECAKGLGKYDGGDAFIFWASEVGKVHKYWGSH